MHTRTFAFASYLGAMWDDPKAGYVICHQCFANNGTGKVQQNTTLVHVIDVCFILMCVDCAANAPLARLDRPRLVRRGRRFETYAEEEQAEGRRQERQERNTLRVEIL